MSAVEYKLNYPVTVDGETIEKIVLQRPRGRQMRSLSGSPKLGDLLDMASKCSGVLPRVFDEMDGSDCICIGEIVGGFFVNGRATGNS
jgi:hypothetical protein